MARDSPPRDPRPADPLRVCLALPCEVASAGAARRAVLQRCRGVGVDADALDRLELLVSEVVTNAVLHGRSDVRLEACLLSDPPPRVRVEVADDNSRWPAVQRSDAGALDGRGLTILEALSRSWGVEDAPVGKVVWFEVDVHDGA